MRKAIASMMLAAGLVVGGLGLVPQSQGQFGEYRIGAICKDGWQSNATSSGACSHHGGVACWLYSDAAFVNTQLRWHEREPNNPHRR